MKKNIFLLGFSILTLSGLSSYAQTSKPVADTGKVNKEYVKVSNEIADLTAQLATAKNNLVVYKRALKSLATDSIIAQARAAKAFEQNPQSVNHSLNSQHDKITILAAEISKKEQQLRKLQAAQAVL